MRNHRKIIIGILNGGVISSMASGIICLFIDISLSYEILINGFTVGIILGALLLGLSFLSGLCGFRNIESFVIIDMGILIIGGITTGYLTPQYKAEYLWILLICFVLAIALVGIATILIWRSISKRFLKPKDENDYLLPREDRDRLGHMLDEQMRKEKQKDMENDN